MYVCTTVEIINDIRDLEHIYVYAHIGMIFDFHVAGRHCHASVPQQTDFCTENCRKIITNFKHMEVNIY